MTGLRRILLAIIAVLSGAWLGLDSLKNKTRQAARPKTPLPPPGPATIGAKGGTLALPRTKRAAPGFEASAAAPGAVSSLRDARPAEKPASAPAGADGHGDVRAIKGPLGYLMELFKRFGADHCPAWAAALSFFSLLSFVPLILAGLALVSQFLSPETARQQVEVFLTSLVPGKTAQGGVRALLEEINIEQQVQNLKNFSNIAGMIGFLSLLWAATRIFVNAATPMNAAFRTQETRGFWKMQFMAFGMLVAVGALFLLSFIPSAGPALINRLPLPFDSPDPPGVLLNIVFFALALVFNAAMFTVIYKWVPSPSAGVQWKEALVGGVVVAVLWEAAKQGFTFYLRRFGQGYNEMYGLLAGGFIAVVWVYYSSMILLLGAEIAEIYSDVREAKVQE